jgi:hypothetical protein
MTAAADDLMARSTFQWMCGATAAAGAGSTLSAQKLEQLGAGLRSEDEATRLHAGYALGQAASATPDAVPMLVEALREQVQRAASSAGARSSCSYYNIMITWAFVWWNTVGYTTAQVNAMARGIVWDAEDFIEAARPPANLHGTNPTALPAAQVPAPTSHRR